MFVLSFSSAFAAAEDQDSGLSDSASKTGSEALAESASDEDTEAEKPVAKVIKKGKYYYYQNKNGTIRKKAGFVKAGGNIYYIRRGGRIRTDCKFRTGGKVYRADAEGVIQTGIYKWHGKYYYSSSKGAWRKKKGFISWNGSKYYIQKGGKVITNDGFTVDNEAFCADKKGRVTDIELDGDGSPVVKVAKKQVGIMTGKKYWVWYYKTKFLDTDRTPWCGAFVAWCFNKAGQYKKVSVAKKFGSLGYVPSYSRYAQKYGKWIKTKKAKGGDIIIFGSNMHVGIVEGVYDGYIVTIEGNSGPTAAWGCGKPGAVVRKIYKLDNKKIKGVLRP